MGISSSYDGHGKAYHVISTFSAEAACKGGDTSLFYPGRDGEVGGWNRDDAEKVARAKVVCDGCSVLEKCLNYAMDYEEPFGIWGGLTSRERNKLRKTWVKGLGPVPPSAPPEGRA